MRSSNHNILDYSPSAELMWKHYRNRLAEDLSLVWRTEMYLFSHHSWFLNETWVIHLSEQERQLVSMFYRHLRSHSYINCVSLFHPLDPKIWKSPFLKKKNIYLQIAISMCHTLTDSWFNQVIYIFGQCNLKAFTMLNCKAFSFLLLRVRGGLTTFDVSPYLKEVVTQTYIVQSAPNFTC